MIKSIALEYFQSHKCTVLNLDPGINVIRGQSRRGKSSIIRGLRWVVENRPAGDSFRSNFADGDTMVRIETDDGWTERRKGKNTNQYAASTLKEPIKAMGQSVPDEITKLLNLGPINMQYQHDTPFLLSKGSGEVAQFLNKTAQLDVIDSATSVLRKQKLSNEEQKRANSAELESIETGLKQYEHLQETEATLRVLEGAQVVIRHKQQQAVQLRKLLDETSTLEQQRREQSQKLRDASEPLSKALTLEKDFRRVQAKVDSLSDVLDTAQRLQGQVAELKRQTIPNKQLKTFRDDLFKLKLMRDRADSIRTLIAAIGQHQLDAMTVKEQLIESEQELRETIPDVCPLCKRPGWRATIEGPVTRKRTRSN